MKQNVLLIIALLLGFGWQLGVAQSVTPLTSADHKNYTISINQKDIKKARPLNADIYPYNSFLKVIVKFSNNSNETLHYISMSCGWEINFTTDNNLFKIAGGACQHNIPEMKTISPHQTNSFTLYIGYNKTAISSCKIGMLIIKDVENQNLMDFFMNMQDVKSYKENLIWSNPVQIPK